MPEVLGIYFAKELRTNVHIIKKKPETEENGKKNKNKNTITSSQSAVHGREDISTM